MKLAGYKQVSNLAPPEAIRHIEANFQLLLPIINGGIEFGSNIRSGNGEIDIRAAGQVVAIPHNLPQIPTGYLVVYQDTAAVIYAAPSSYTWTLQNIFLTASAPVRARVIVI